MSKALTHALHVGQATDDPGSVAFAIAPLGVASEDLPAHSTILAMSPAAARDVIRLIELAATAAEASLA
jgi:hypothetical protein